MSNQIYFGLWAEDIGKYLSTGYNSNSIDQLKRVLLGYVSIDTDNPEGIENSSLSQLLGMTGLALDYKYSHSHTEVKRMKSQQVAE